MVIPRVRFQQRGQHRLAALAFDLQPIKSGLRKCRPGKNDRTIRRQSDAITRQGQRKLTGGFHDTLRVIAAAHDVAQHKHREPGGRAALRRARGRQIRNVLAVVRSFYAKQYQILPGGVFWQTRRIRALQHISPARRQKDVEAADVGDGDGVYVVTGSGESLTVSDRGASPTAKLVAGLKPPAPFPNSTDTLSDPWFAAARSGLPSRLKSPTVTD